jgi:CxxC-x17-CxxC domain-containing protein
MKNKILKCIDCGVEFEFTVGEQEFFQKKGFTHEPKRCSECLAQKKAKYSEKQNINQKKILAKCSRCGITFNAPFQPKPGLPIFCRNCLKKNS